MKATNNTPHSSATPHSIVREILSKIRRACGAAFKFLSTNFRCIWSLLRWITRLLRPITPKNAAFDSLSSCTPCSRPFIAPATAPHADDLFTVDLGQSADHTGYSSSSQSSGSPTLTQAPEGWFECGQWLSESQTQEDEERTIDDVQRTDVLQPMALPPQLRPVRPLELFRYEPKTPISTDRATFTVTALQTDFCPQLPLPEGWKAVTQFEGQVFFYHKEKKIITETWLYNADWCQEITSFIQMIHEFRKVNQIQIPSGSELVLELRYDSDAGENYCGYYFAHPKRFLFWLQDVDLDEGLTEVRGGKLAPEHAKKYLEYEYWAHYEYFATIRKTSPTVLRELRATLLNALTDTATSHLSTVTHSEKQLTNMLKIVDGASKDLNEGGRGCPFSVGKIMSQFSHEQFLNFHGQEAARLARYQSIYDEPSRQEKRSWLMWILSLMLFYVPDVHLRNLDKIWVDKIAAKGPWVNFIEKLTSEWSEHTAFATILLNANVAFLDIPGIVSGESPQSLGQVLSSISLILSVGSAILGLMLVRQHRTKRIGTADEAVLFFNTHKLEPTAVIYSLPYVLLMYAMGFFLLAFVLSCFLGTSFTMRLSAGVFCACVSTLVLWCLAWQTSEDSTTLVPSWLRCAINYKWRNSPDSSGEDSDQEKDSQLGQEDVVPQSITEFFSKPKNSAEEIV